ncbi:MAG: hypothetical protein R3D59_13700 [Paracoccaceae bacterium]
MLTDQGGGDFSVEFVTRSRRMDDRLHPGRPGRAVMAGPATNSRAPATPPMAECRTPISAWRRRGRRISRCATRRRRRRGSRRHRRRRVSAGYVDVDGDAVDGGDGSGAAGNEDVISGHGGDDTISAGAEDDLVYGGAGADVIDGGDGDDTLYGGDGDFTDPMVLDWSAQGPDNTNLAAGFTQNTGGIDVTVSFTNAGNNNPVYRVESTDTTYVGPGESFDPNSSLYLYGERRRHLTTIGFAAAAGTSYRDEVENVTFRINDVDWGSGSHTDVITVNAWDADGNPVSVTSPVAATPSATWLYHHRQRRRQHPGPGRRFGADRIARPGRRDPDQLRQHLSRHRRSGFPTCISTPSPTPHSTLATPSSAAPGRM